MLLWAPFQKRRSKYPGYYSLSRPQDHPMVKEENSKVEGCDKPKGRRFQQSTSNQKVIFKASESGLEGNVFKSDNIYAVDLVKNCEEISNFIAVRYKHGRHEMAFTTKNAEILTINAQLIPENTYRSLDIFICKKIYKESKSKEKTLKKRR